MHETRRVFAFIWLVHQWWRVQFKKMVQWEARPFLGWKRANCTSYSCKAHGESGQAGWTMRHSQIRSFFLGCFHPPTTRSNVQREPSIWEVTTHCHQKQQNLVFSVDVTKRHDTVSWLAQNLNLHSKLQPPLLLQFHSKALSDWFRLILIIYC